MKNKNNVLLSKNQYLLLTLSLALIIFGFWLMSGASLENPEIFDQDSLFSFTRTKLSSFFIVWGYILVAFTVLKTKENS